mmetsp:Transcript_5291/g.10475  ORF Transcript_5291/g.10475 Transcript_5291/m.10475 type:complete len:229 (-) Transcript_5291:3361-4047(-)
MHGQDVSIMQTYEEEGVGEESMRLEKLFGEQWIDCRMDRLINGCIDCPVGLEEERVKKKDTRQKRMQHNTPHVEDDCMGSHVKETLKIECSLGDWKVHGKSSHAQPNSTHIDACSIYTHKCMHACMLRERRQDAYCTHLLSRSEGVKKETHAPIPQPCIKDCSLLSPKILPSFPSDVFFCALEAYETPTDFSQVSFDLSLASFQLSFQLSIFLFLCSSSLSLVFLLLP